MTFLLITGQENTGKTETIARFYLELLRKGYTVKQHWNPLPTAKIIASGKLKDFSIELQGVNSEGKQITIAIHSATDDKDRIDELEKFINLTKPDIVITSSRYIGSPRTLVMSIVGSRYCFEIPLAKIWNHKGVKAKVLSNYRDKVDSVIKTISEHTPYNL